MFADRQLWKVEPRRNAGTRHVVGSRRRAGRRAATRTLYQLSFDGITLVTVENGKARHTIKDLSKQNAGSRNPLDRPTATRRAIRRRAMLRNVEDCYRDGESLRNLFVRPNQVFLTNANRADVFFKAPQDAAGKVYTILAQEFLLHTDNFQQRLQMGVASRRQRVLRRQSCADRRRHRLRPRGRQAGGRRRFRRHEPAGIGCRPCRRICSLSPTTSCESRPRKAAARRCRPDSFRTRVLSYSGYGPTDFPLIEVPDAFARRAPGAEEAAVGRDRRHARAAAAVLAHDGDQRAVRPRGEPGAAGPQKFGHHDPPTRAFLSTPRGVGHLQLLDPALEPHRHQDVQAARAVRRLHYRSYPLSQGGGPGALRRRSGVPDHDQGRRSSRSTCTSTRSG